MKSFFKFELDELFLGRVKKFLIGYGLFFTLFVITSILITGPPIRSGLYMVFLSSILATSLLFLCPRSTLRGSSFIRYPRTLFLITSFYNYIQGVGGPYLSLSFVPITLSSLIFNYMGPVVSISRTLISCLILDPHPLLPEFAVKYLPFFTVSTLLAVMGSFVATTLREDRENLASLFVKVARGKKEWETSLDVIDDMITIHDMNDRVIRVNMAVARRLGKNLHDILGRKAENLFKSGPPQLKKTRLCRNAGLFYCPVG